MFYRLLVALALCLPVSAGTVPDNFTESLVAQGISRPTAMEFAPDGRLFVLQQSGQVRVIKNGLLLAQPFISLTVNSQGERGLLGIAFDPNFAQNRFVYLYYTSPSPVLRNRVSRFLANGDQAVPGSEQVLMDLDPLTNATNHNGGAMHFGKDGKLYIAVGENATPSNSQSLGTVQGKMLRINPNGSIPTDNPFYGSTTGNNRAIWALGLRNPFTFAIRPGTGQILINDVGQDAWEEINQGVVASNYGWPTVEGPSSDPRFRAPVFSYGHFTNDPVVGGGCAITGGTFYSPPRVTFPTSYLGSYFFADYCGSWINVINSRGVVTRFLTGGRSPVDLKTGLDGSLYYLSQGAGAVYKVAYTKLPGIVSSPTGQTVRVGTQATFSVVASGAAPLSFQWQRNNVAILEATAASYTTGPLTLADDASTYRAIVTNPFGSVTSDPALLTVTTSQAPLATILTPAAGTLFSGDETFFYSGTATDPEDGVLGGAAFTWQVDYFTGAAPPRPFVPATTGATEGTFTIPSRTPYTLPDVFYRLYLTVRDSNGLTTTTTQDLLPRTAELTLTTVPVGLTVKLDGQPRTTPRTVESVVGIIRSLSAPAFQVQQGKIYDFVSWSDQGNRTHEISTPEDDTTYVAVYRQR